MIAAPWAATLLRSPQDNDKGDLLHRNRNGDEWSPTHEQIAAIEREARAARAEALRKAFAPLASAVASLFRTRGARG